MADAEQRRDSKAGGAGAGERTSSSDRVQLEVSILASASDDTGPGAADDSTAARADGRTVLVVAAESDMRTYVRRCLNRHDDIRVVEAANRNDALRSAQAAVPNVIIVDADGLDSVGIALARGLRAESSLAAVPLLVITDEEPGDNGAELLGSGAPGAIIVKPFNAQRLCSEVERLINLGPPGES